MTWFWVIGAALAVAALILVLRPLLWRRARARIDSSAANVAIYRDQLRELDADLAGGTLAQEDYDRARRELEARMLEDVSGAGTKSAATGGRAVAAVVAIAVPVCALAVYLAVGSPGALESPEHNIESMVARLAAHLRTNTDDVSGWKLLGRSYAALGRFPEAADAYARAAVREPRDAQLLADLADTLAMARGQRLAGEPEKLILRALEIDPENLKALALAGTAAYDRKDYSTAAAYWQRMLPLVPADSEDARAIQANINEARALSGKDGKKSGLRGTVAIAPQLKDQVSPDDTVFIIARAAEGPPAPLAVLKAKASQLPLSFALDDSLAMAPGMAVSAFPRIVVIARVSKSGKPASQAGDLQGSSKPVANDASGVTVVIDSQVR